MCVYFNKIHSHHMLTWNSSEYLLKLLEVGYIREHCMDHPDRTFSSLLARKLE